MVPPFFFFFVCALPTLFRAIRRQTELRGRRSSFCFTNLYSSLPLQIMSRLVVISSVLTDSLMTLDAPPISNYCAPVRSLSCAFPVSRRNCNLSPSISLSPNSLQVAKSPRLGTLQCHTYISRLIDNRFDLLFVEKSLTKTSG